jgi:hypothetical protein
MPKRILHLDVFGTQLKDLVNRVDEEGSHHPRIADAFFNSFRTYKGRVFLLVSCFIPYEVHKLTRISVNTKSPLAPSQTGPTAYLPC